MSGAEVPAAGRDYCDTLLREGDEDRWLATRFAPASVREALVALFALMQEIERVPAAVSEAPLGEIRLQWWREALDELAAGKSPRAHPVVMAVAGAGLVGRLDRDALEALIDARARLLYGEGFSSGADLAAWLRAAEAPVLVLAAELGGPLSAAARAGLEDGATAYALARRVRALAPEHREAAGALAAALLECARDGLAGLAPDSAAGALPIALARAWLKRDRPPSGLEKRLILFRAAATGRLG